MITPVMSSFSTHILFDANNFANYIHNRFCNSLRSNNNGQFLFIIIIILFRIILDKVENEDEKPIVGPPKTKDEILLNVSYNQA